MDKSISLQEQLDEKLDKGLTPKEQIVYDTLIYINGVNGKNPLDSEKEIDGSESKTELIEKWITENDMAGDNPWFDPENTYYNLRADQIIRLGVYLEDNF